MLATTTVRARLLYLLYNGPWITTALLIAVAILFVDERADDAASRVLGGHLAAAAASSHGGVLFVLSPVDCVETRDMLEELAADLLDDGFVVRGLVISDGVASQDLRVLLDDANRRFAHYPIPMRAAALVGNMSGIRRTPVMVTVNGTTGRTSVAPVVTRDGLPDHLRRHVAALIEEEDY